ncbi:MAG: DUF3237 domain-containing protein [Xylophilus ampelinus]
MTEARSTDPAPLADPAGAPDAATAASTALPVPALEHFADLSVEVGPPHHVGAAPRGVRRMVPIVGGTVRGQGWRARVLPGGADFQLLLEDGLSDLDARYTLETDAGDMVYVQNRALRCGPPAVMEKLARGEPVDPALVYFRCVPRFETASVALGWINRRLFLGTGARHPDRVEMRFFVVR